MMPTDFCARPIQVAADLTATVIAVLACPGDLVDAGTEIALLESMKMEIPILAGQAGTVAKVAVRTGDTVRAGELLCEIAPISCSCCNPEPDATALAALAALGTSRDPADRLAALFDEGTAAIEDDPAGSGVYTARGQINGLAALAYASDPKTKGGALGQSGCDKIVAVINAAIAESIPVIGLWHSGGARLAEGVESLNGMGEMFAAIVRASGRIPQVSVVLGPAAGGAAYGPALTDVVIMVEGSQIFVTGPKVVRSVTGEDIDMEHLGGTTTHMSKSGVAHMSAPDQQSALESARTIITLLRGEHRTAWSAPACDPGRHLPEQPDRAYDVLPIISAILDHDELGDWQELQPDWAPNIVTGLGRFQGAPVGVVASNPIRMGGCLDSKSAEKSARFVRLCDAFGIPLLVLVDVPGYLPGVDQEWDGVVRRGAKLLHAFADAEVPRVTVVLRKAYGGAYIAMNSRSLGATAVLAWPEAEVQVMGATAAVRVLHRRELAAAPDAQRPALEQHLSAEHRRALGGLQQTVKIAVVDQIIEPADTRSAVAAAFDSAPARRNDIRNIPL